VKLAPLTHHLGNAGCRHLGDQVRVPFRFVTGDPGQIFAGLDDLVRQDLGVVDCPPDRQGLLPPVVVDGVGRDQDQKHGDDNAVELRSERQAPGHTFLLALN